MVIVLAMHGMIPKDFPLGEKREFLRLHTQLDFAKVDPNSREKQRHDELDQKMRKWPRTEENDTYHRASHELAEHIQKLTGNETIVAFNEFCAPTIQEAFGEAAKKRVDRVVVVTPMLTRGGGHAEYEIPEIIEQAKRQFPQITFSYAWPFDTGEIAEFLSRQVNRFRSISDQRG